MNERIWRMADFDPDREACRRRFWNDKLALPIEWIELADEEKAEPLRLFKNAKADGIFLSLEASVELLQVSPRIPTAVREAGLADCLLRENGALWLRCVIRESLRQLILQQNPKLDTHAQLYVTGSKGPARMATAVGVHMGFQKIILICRDLAEGEALGENLKRSFFGLDFKTLPESELTLQPNNGSLLINTLDKNEEGGVLEDLTYLNFLKQEGLVVDLPLTLGANPLLDEATHVGIGHLSGSRVWALRDFLFLQSLQIPLPNWTTYDSSWSEFLVQETTPTSTQANPS